MGEGGTAGGIGPYKRIVRKAMGTMCKHTEPSPVLIATSGGKSVFSNKKTISNSVRAVQKIRRGNHPAVKNKAKALLKNTGKAIFKESISDLGDGVLAGSAEYGTKIYSGIYNGSKLTQKKLRGCTQ